MSEPFDIERGVLQGDIFSPVSFIAGLDRILRRHDISNSGVIPWAQVKTQFAYPNSSTLTTLHHNNRRER